MKQANDGYTGLRCAEKSETPPNGMFQIVKIPYDTIVSLVGVDPKLAGCIRTTRLPKTVNHIFGLIPPDFRLKIHPVE